MFRADRKAGTVDEVHDGQVEGICEINVAHDLVACIGRPGAIEEERIACDDCDGMPVHAGEARDDLAAPKRADLEEGAAIADACNDLARHVGRLAVLRHDVEQEFLAAAWIILALDDRRRLVDIGGQVGKEAPGLFESFVFGVDDIVDNAVAAVDLPAAEAFLVDILADRLGDRRACDEHLGQTLDHDREMARGDTACAEASAWSKRQRDNRRAGHVGDQPFPGWCRRDVGARVLLERFHGTAAACAVDHAYDRHAVLVGHLLGHQHLAGDGGVRRAAAHGEIVTQDDSRSPVQRGAAKDHRGGQEFGDLLVRPVARLACDLADLMEAAGVGEEGHALAHCQLAHVALAGDAFLPAHLLGQPLARP